MGDSGSQAGSEAFTGEDALPSPRREERRRERLRFFGLFHRPKDPVTGLPEIRRRDFDVEFGAQRTRGGRQVNVKLSPALYEALCTAAEYYDTKPTSLARLLVARGARAIAEEIDSERFADIE
jgi:hypothetical protein